MGRFSYSIDLSRLLLLAVLQHALLRWAPGLGRLAHFWILLALTTAATITVSSFFYQRVEAPGIRVGRVLANRLARKYNPAQAPEQPRPAVQP